MNPHSRCYVPAVVRATFQDPALPLPPAGFNIPRPVSDSDYGNPLYADTGYSLGMEVPAPWDRWYCNRGSRCFVQRTAEEPVPVMSAAPVCDGGSTRDDEKNSTRVPTTKYGPYHGYDKEIEDTLRAQEREAKPSPDYLETTQRGRMSQDARADLVSWMKAFTRHYNDDLAPGTLHRAVYYADRFLSVRSVEDVAMHRLYLLGAAAVYVAAKYEDQGTVRKMNAEKVARYYGHRSGGFASTKQQVLDMERALLVALDYRLGRPTAYTFVQHFTRHYGQAEVEQDLRSAAHDFADMSLLHYSCLQHNPSAVAAAAMFLARLTLKPWYGQITRSNRELRELTGYEPQKLKRCVEAIHSLIPQYGNGSYSDIDLFPMFYAVAADPR